MGRRGIITAVLAVLVTACGGAGDADPPEEGVLGTGTAATEATEATATTEAAGTRDTVADAPELGGTTWQVTTLKTAEFGFTNVWNDSTVRLEFGADGSLGGFGGCSDLDGSWSVVGGYLEDDPFGGSPEGQELTISATAAGSADCDERFAEQELDLLDDLGAAVSWLATSDGGLVLRSADAAILFAAPGG